MAQGFIINHTNGTVTIRQGRNGFYCCTIEWNNGDISAKTASTMNEINKFLIEESDNLGEEISHKTIEENNREKITGQTTNSLNRQ